MSLTDKSIISVQYNIPRFIIGKQGKQNRACTGEMRLTPGFSEPLEFQYCNDDGVPINLSGYKLRLWFWYPQKQYESLSSNLQGNTILVKDITVENAYEGIATVMLSDQDTLTLARSGRTNIRWSIFIINSDGDVFPTQITSNGERYGMCHLDIDFPNAETIKGTSVI
jgi:hypothetical protein